MATLREYLDELFAAGPVRFEQYMHAALNHRDFGYYAANVTEVGPQGDFSTSATLAPILGQAVARWVESEAAHFSGAEHLHLVEAGPGDGSLLRQVLRSLPWRLRRKLRLHLVEISPALTARQKATLARHRRRITWHRDMPAALAQIGHTAPGPVLLFANEFVDAFAVRVFRQAAPGIEELHLSYRDGGLSEVWLPPSEVPASTVFERSFPPAQRLEVHQSYRDWQHDWLPSFPAGAILTIDYGATVEHLYERRPTGTLRAYHRHERLEGPALYNRFGNQDLTADVNFSDLVAWGEEDGLATVSLLTQSEFLAPFVRSNTEAGAYLADPLGPGGAFQVLHQRRV